MRRLNRHGAVVPVLALMAACATVGPQIEIEGQVALRAVEFQRGVQAVLEAADAANQSGLVSDTDLTTIARLGRRLGLEGGRLAEVLGHVDTARDPVSRAVSVGRAQIIVQTIQQMMTEFPEVPPIVNTALTAVNGTLTILAIELEV